MSMRKLTSENAVIKTAAVEVKTLTISGKQVTLAVFRQLPKRSLIDTENLQLNGLPWGIVNYHPDKCGEDDAHLHVIWQSGQTLYRATETRSKQNGELNQRALACEHKYSLLIIRRDFEEGGWDNIHKLWKSTGYGYSRDIQVANGDKRRYPASLFVEGRGIPGGATDPSLIDSHLEQLYSALDIRAKWYDRYKGLYEQLASLDQLYIAV